MNGGRIGLQLQVLGQRLGWRHWSAGVLDNGLYFIEFETSYSYDEWQFTDEGSILDFLKTLKK